MANFNSTAYIKDYGDGLFGCETSEGVPGDIYCVYRPLSVNVSESDTVFEYEKYTVTVSYTKEGGKKTFTSWRRDYKNG